MAIKSDKWIREMSLQSDMISPFEDKQVVKVKFLMVFLHMGMI